MPDVGRHVSHLKSQNASLTRTKLAPIIRLVQLHGTLLKYLYLQIYMNFVGGQCGARYLVMRRGAPSVRLRTNKYIGRTNITIFRPLSSRCVEISMVYIINTISDIGFNHSL